MRARLTRRRFVMFAAAAGAVASVPGGAQEPPAWSLPIREPGGLPGEGFMISRGYACENLEKYPGWWHTAEDWRLADDRESAGSEVLAIAPGEVIFADYDYPGRVVIIGHRNGVYSVYGHLDPALAVTVGERVAAGQVLGRLFFWTDGRAPSHLHFEVRDFYLNPIVNGDAPNYGVTCGFRCPPGPGYWPMQDGRHPAELGWRNPTHVIGQAARAEPPPAVRVATTGHQRVVPLWAGQETTVETRSEIVLVAGERFPVVAVAAGEPATRESSALGYRLRYRVALRGGLEGWLDAVAPDDRKVGADGRPASVRLLMLPEP